MSVGFFIGVHGSFTEEAQDAADDLIAAINEELDSLGLPAYRDPPEPPSVYVDGLFGRSALDHDSARLLGELGALALRGRPSPNLSLLVENPYRVVFVPRNFETPFLTRFEDRIGGTPTRIWCGSAEDLWQEIVAVAEDLGVPLADGRLADDTARRINEYLPLSPGEPQEDPAADLRTTWLVVHEAARLASSTGVALSLAG